MNLNRITIEFLFDRPAIIISLHNFIGIFFNVWVIPLWFHSHKNEMEEIFTMLVNNCIEH